MNLTVNGKKDSIRYRTRFRLDPEEKGIDLAEPVYVGAYGEWTKKGGIGMIEPGKPGVRMLQWDDARYATLLKAKKADVYLYTRETVQGVSRFLRRRRTAGNGQKVTDANPQQKDFLWPSGVQDRGLHQRRRATSCRRLSILPANYEPARAIPTIVYIYEKLSQRANRYPQPGFNGFNIVGLHQQRLRGA